MSTDGDGSIKVVPVRHVGRWIGVAAALVVVALIVHTLLSRLPTGQRACRGVGTSRVCHAITEWRFSWDIVFHYFTTSEILHGLLITLELTVIAMAVGIVLGMILAVMRLSPNRVLSGSAWTYTWFFRGTPVLVQLLVWFNISILYPRISLGIPFLHVSFLALHTSTVFTPLEAACVALGLNEGAYMSEIARAGLLSVDEGQVEAATSIGMVRRQTLRYVVMPQAMRVIIPPTGNEVISMLKTSSLASVIGVIELLGAATNIYSANYEIMPLLLTASLWYLVVTTVLSIGQFYLERYFARGALRTPPPTPLQRMRHDLAGVLSKFPNRRSVAGALER
ncbi:MAG TPA: amino acid ABC transporter permease [Acidimicrobiales bacterium]|nr:amino acid ABC transporter permease [Acidimicrobiales bacterium]